MSTTSKHDANWFSVSNNTFQFFAGTDKVAQAEGIPNPPIFGSDAPGAWDTYLKICDGTHDLKISGICAKQGMEGTVDFNNGAHHVALAGDFGWGGGSGDQVVTLKGGCHDISLAGVIYSRGNEADIVIDAWSDQSRELCYNIDLSNLTRADGQPITIILGRFGSTVAHYPPSHKVLWWKSIGYRAYWLAKRAAVALHLLG
jgi:hypothetical protein